MNSICRSFKTKIMIRLQYVGKMKFMQLSQYYPKIVSQIKVESCPTKACSIQSATVCRLMHTFTNVEIPLKLGLTCVLCACTPDNSCISKHDRLKLFTPFFKVNVFPFTILHTHMEKLSTLHIISFFWEIDTYDQNMHRFHCWGCSNTLFLNPVLLLFRKYKCYVNV